MAVSLKPGDDLIGRYRIEGKLGEGQNGALYCALDTLFGRACTVQEVCSAAPDELRRQLRQMAQVEHPHLPRAGDAFCLGEAGYLVADLVGGRSLAALLQERQGGQVAPAVALAWLDPVMDALAACHEAELAHQSVAPENLVLLPGGKVSLVGLGLGLPEASPYLAPELAGGGDPTAASDIYALGATLYTLLTGRAPVPGRDRTSGGALAAPRDLAPDLPAEVEAAVLRAMAVHPQERFHGMAEMRLMLAAEMAPGAAGPLWSGGLHPILAASHAPLVLYDDFDADSSGWDTGEAEDELSITTQEIAGGRYRWQAKALEGFSWWCCPDVPPTADLYVTVEARQERGPWTTEHGLVFRADGDDHYTFSIRNDQQCTAYLEYQGETRVLLGWRPTPAIEPCAANRLTVVASGAHFTLLINDQVVGTFDDDTLAEGRTGLLVGLDKAGDEAVIEFDQFELRA